MPTAKLFAPTGEEKGTVDLPEWAFGSRISRHVMWEAVRNHLANARQGTAKVKNRASVSGGGSKPWAQKKTGRARAGTSRSVLWVGGGRAFGPRPRSYRSEMPVSEMKTREVSSVLMNLGLGRTRTLLVLPEHDERILRASRNLPNLETTVFSNLNTYQVLRSDRLLLLESTVDRMREVEVSQ
jgi:large subunit ribosomal protein L4